MSDRPELLIEIHRWVGYPTAFVVAPLAVLAFARPVLHRAAGKGYLILMTFLYLTGTYVTLTQHEWHTWDFARNVVFNFFGYSLLLYGWRAIRLFRMEGQPEPARLDWMLAGLLTVSVAALVFVASFRDTPMRIFAAVGLVLCAFEYRELRGGFRPKSVLFRRHTRFILASYFYVMTVVSIVHLGDELPRNIKWTWPTVFGAAVIALTGTGARYLYQPRARSLRLAVRATAVVALLYAGYVAYDLRQGAPVVGQGAAEGRDTSRLSPGSGTPSGPTGAAPARDGSGSAPPSMSEP